MKKNSKRIKKIIILICIILTFFGLFLYWIYSGNFTNAKKTILEKVPFPMAIVNGEFVSLKKYHERQLLEEKIGIAVSNNSSKAGDKPHAYNAIIEEVTTRQIAASKGVWVNQNELSEEYNKVSQLNLEQFKEELEVSLKNYNLSPNTYKENILKPELLKAKLMAWYNSEEKLNLAVYAKAKDLLSKIQSGEDFGFLAKNYSEDLNDKASNGDLGFVDITETLTELREALSSMKISEVKILPSRYGLHIIKIEDTNENKLHLKQIFIQNNSFEQWFEKEKNKIKVIYLLNI